MNADWHRAHVLGPHASMDARVAWHEEHVRECACREIPATVAAEIDRRAAGRDGSAAPSARARE
jgi:hypothetical protein